MIFSPQQSLLLRINDELSPRGRVRRSECLEVGAAPLDKVVVEYARQGVSTVGCAEFDEVDGGGSKDTMVDVNLSCKEKRGRGTSMTANTSCEKLQYV